MFWRFRHSFMQVSSSARSSSGGADGVQGGSQVARPSSWIIEEADGGCSLAGAMWCFRLVKAVRWRSGSSSVLMSEDDEDGRRVCL